MKSVMKTILVVSQPDENPDEIAAKYSEEYELEQPYEFMTINEAKDLKNIDRMSIDLCLSSKTVTNILSDAQKEYLQNRYIELKNMTNKEYFRQMTDGCEIDSDGRAWTTKNPMPFYKYPKCYQEKLEKTGEEANFSNPFMLKDGSIAYRARFDEINWEEMHNHNRHVYEAAWELCVEGREPENRHEHMIKEQMENRQDYFLNFKNKEDYVDYSTMFFAYGIATNETFIKRDELEETEMEYIRSFYDKYLKNLKGDQIISIYEVRSLG